MKTKKYSVIFLSVLLCLAFFAGCTDNKSNTDYLDKLRADTSVTKEVTEPKTTAEPTTAEKTTAEPTTAQPTTAEPTTAEPTTLKETDPPEESDESSEEDAAVQESEEENNYQVQNASHTYILNTNSKRFHYPDCSSVSKMKDENKQEFTGSRDEVISMGYKPCGNCNP